MEENLIHLDIASAFGAQPKGQRFAIYVPNKDNTASQSCKRTGLKKACGCSRAFAAVLAPCRPFKVLG